MKTCELCGLRDVGVTTALAWYIEGGTKPIDRCRDHDACRSRVEASGEDWPLESSAEARRRILTEGPDREYLASVEPTEPEVVASHDA